MEMFLLNVVICTTVCGLFTYFLYRQEVQSEKMIQRMNNKRDSLQRNSEEEQLYSIAQQHNGSASGC